MRRSLKIVNPLSNLLKSLGISLHDAAKLANVRVDLLDQLLEENPQGALGAYIRLINALGYRYRLTKADPINISLDMAPIDKLFYDDQFRHKMGVTYLYSDTTKLKKWMREFRKKDKSLDNMVITLNKNFIPTFSGGYPWIPNHINRDVKMKSPAVKLIANETCLSAWRVHVVDKIITECASLVPSFQLRYGMWPRFETGKCILETTRDIPDSPKEWFMANLRGMSWVKWANEIS